MQGGLLRIDAVVSDGGGGMRAGKSLLHSKPINEIRTNLWLLCRIGLKSGFPAVADSGGIHVWCLVE